MLTAALIGNPNVGKTTLFNTLTGSNYKVGNWAGVTVEKKEGFLNKNIKIVDLPGIYAMDTYSNEEKVAKTFLETEDVDVILNIVDASNLSRNLYLTTELKRFNKPIVLLLNMMDIAKEKGINYDLAKLEANLDLSIIPISATNTKTLNKVIDFLESRDFSGLATPSKHNFTSEADAYRYIDNALKDSTISVGNSAEDKWTKILDSIVLNRFLAFPIFFLLLFLIFKLTFSWVGQPLSDLLGSLMENKLTPYLSNLLSGSSPWFSSLIIDGIIGGVGQVIVFLPVILCLFLGISALEDSGYMARTAFIMDKLMRSMGLSGKAFIPFIIGFGCSVPAVMSSRTLESEKDRKLSALLVPFISCNARLPVYTLFASVFFFGYETEVIFSLYLLGIFVAFLMGILLSKTSFKNDDEPLVIEIPRYQIPNIKNLCRNTLDKASGFIKKAGTLIFSMSVLIWILSSFNLTGYISNDNINNSFLAYIGKFIAPIFTPLGFGDWQSSVSLITGIMAKEVILGTMGVIYGSGQQLSSILPAHFTTISAYSFLVFVLLYTPCISVIGAMKKEFGGKFAAFSVIFQFVVAWIASFIIFNIGSAIF